MLVAPNDYFSAMACVRDNLLKQFCDLLGVWIIYRSKYANIRAWFKMIKISFYLSCFFDTEKLKHLCFFRLHKLRTCTFLRNWPDVVFFNYCWLLWLITSQSSTFNSCLKLALDLDYFYWLAHLLLEWVIPTTCLCFSGSSHIFGRNWSLQQVIIHKDCWVPWVFLRVNKIVITQLYVYACVCQFACASPAAPGLVTNLTAFAQNHTFVMVTWFLPHRINGLITKFAVKAKHARTGQTVRTLEVNAEDIMTVALPHCNVLQYTITHRILNRLLL